VEKNKESVLFEIKFKASVKKFEELLSARDIKSAATLFEKMQKEANRVEISAIDGFSDKLLSVHKHTFKLIEAKREEFERLHQKLLGACEAILRNQFEDEAHKKQSIELLNVYKGMAQYGNDAKLYRDALIEFCDWVKGVNEQLAKFVKDENMPTLLNFLEELQTRAQKIELKEILEFVTSINQVITQEKTHFTLLIESYQKSIKV
jgi:hypothetical protein